MSVPAAGRPGGQNKFGKISELRLVAARRGEKTVLEDVSATMPFHVMHPFEVPTAGLACASAGLPSGVARRMLPARRALPAEFSPRSRRRSWSCRPPRASWRAMRSASTSPSAKARRFRSRPRPSTRSIGWGGRVRLALDLLRVADGGYLDYSPQPTIPFADSAFAATTAVELEGPDARFVYEEVLSCGRAARGERFGYRSFRNHVRVDVAGTPAYVDNTVYEPGLMPMEEFGFYEGFSHLGNLVIVNCRVSAAAFAAARDYLREETGVIGAAAGSPVGAATGSEAVAGGVTRLASGDVCVRLLGHRAQRVGDVLDRVRSLLSEAC